MEMMIEMVMRFDAERAMAAAKVVDDDGDDYDFDDFDFDDHRW